MTVAPPPTDTSFAPGGRPRLVESLLDAIDECERRGALLNKLLARAMRNDEHRHAERRIVTPLLSVVEHPPAHQHRSGVLE
jgi:hypothetical protein